jgi:hypothetical protein
MNTNRSLRLVTFAVLALVTACFGASRANAQEVQGTFNLPFEVHWGRTVLPPGNYSFTSDSGPVVPAHTVIVRGENNMACIMIPMVFDHSFSGKNALTVERHGESATVRELRLPDAGLVIYYPPAKAQRQILAQGPVLIQHLPILMAEK